MPPGALQRVSDDVKENWERRREGRAWERMGKGGGRGGRLILLAAYTSAAYSNSELKNIDSSNHQSGSIRA